MLKYVIGTIVLMFSIVSVASYDDAASEFDMSAPVMSVPTQTSGINRVVTAFDNNLKLKENRKMGVGAGVGGALGLAGVNFELNIEDADGAIAGFGGGEGYSSFQLAWKHTFYGKYFAPYAAAGVSRWYNSEDGKSYKNASGILGRVLTNDEKQNGHFAKDFATASFGLQYNQLSGDFSGMSFYGELTALLEVHQGMLLPTGAVGALYYF